MVHPVRPFSPAAVPERDAPRIAPMARETTRRWALFDYLVDA
jgi:hypothetical protein